MDSQPMTAREIGEMMLHVFDCWSNGMVGDCCPEWTRVGWAKAVACDFRGYRKPAPTYRYYGSQWPVIRAAVLDRDGRCRGCGRGGPLDVHHRKPFTAFVSRNDANAMDNLVALCKSCHVTADRAYRRDGTMFVEASR